MDALILVDIQNDFLPGGALAVPRGDEIIAVANRLQERFGLVVATQDWHPAGHASFASSHPGENVYEAVVIDGVEQILWPDHCVQGSRGAELARAFNTNRVEAIFRKGTDPGIDSYSTFYDNARRKSTGLEGYLKWKKVDRVFLAGLAADFCVSYSIMDALAMGFGAVLVKDATRAISEEGFRAAEKAIVAKGGTVVLSNEI
ncbi:MAG: bifunctional nicotinamidase/pyrazinamidase [Candidatus Aminicenantales bacterium]